MMRHGGPGRRGGHRPHSGMVGGPGRHRGMGHPGGPMGGPFRPIPMFRPFWGGGMMGWGGFLFGPTVIAVILLMVIGSTITTSLLPVIIGVLLIIAGLVVLTSRQPAEKTKRKNDTYADEYADVDDTFYDEYGNIVE